MDKEADEMLRRARRRPPGGPEVELPITPMLDMAFQLLFFFLMMYQPGHAEQEHHMKDPEAEKTHKPTVEVADPDHPGEPKPPDPKLPPYRLTITVATNQGGERGKAGTEITQILVGGLSKSVKEKLQADPGLAGLEIDPRRDDVEVSSLA